jgi:hypothetical protein
MAQGPQGVDDCKQLPQVQLVRALGPGSGGDLQGFHCELDGDWMVCAIAPLRLLLEDTESSEATVTMLVDRANLESPTPGELELRREIH